MALRAVAGRLGHLVDLTGHVGGIHQGEPATGGGGKIAFRHMGQIGVGRRLAGGRDIDAAMAGGPAPIEEILVEAGARLVGGEGHHLPLQAPEAPDKGGDDHRQPEELEQDQTAPQLAFGCGDNRHGTASPRQERPLLVSPSSL